MSRQGRRGIHAAQGIIPLALAVALIAYVLGSGSDLVLPDSVILPEVTIEKIEFTGDQILATVRNTGQIEVTIAQADINDRIQPSAAEPDATLHRLETALIRIPYSWNTGEPYEIGITLDDGTRFARVIEAAVPALKADPQTILNIVTVGALVGVIPVMIGLLWRPFVARLDENRQTLVLGITVGLLVFIAAATVREALDVSAEWQLDAGFNGQLLIFTVGTMVFLGIQYVSALLRGSGRSAPMIISIIVAGGIGLHNLGEGLAIGAAIGLGQAAFTSFLIAGIALHNMTEGFAITAPVAKRPVRAVHLLLLGLLAGLPVVAGTIAGSLAFSPLVATVLLAAASGAIAQIVMSMVLWMRSQNMRVSSPPMLAGVGLGILILYAVSVLS